jgi:hypothetical protein
MRSWLRALLPDVTPQTPLVPIMALHTVLETMSPVSFFFVRFRVELSNGLYKVNKIFLQTSFRPADQQDLGEQELKKGDR